MARYFFHIHNGQDLPDESGTTFPGVKQAREEAIQTASELLRGNGDEFWNGPDWTMRVTDQKQPGEKEPGTFHYNPGNMSGKTPSTASKDDSGSARLSRTKRQNRKTAPN